MAQWAEIRSRITDRTGVRLQPASEAEITRLQSLNVPEDAVSFFREAEPAEHAEIEGVRLLPISTVIDENTRYVPGAYIRPHGYIVFATTLYGDTYCFDLNNAVSRETAPIVLISHEMVAEDTSKDELRSLAKPIAADLETFLAAYVAGTLDIAPKL
jgi:hypothetical protein